MKNNQKGTSILAFIALIAVLILVGFVGYFVWDKNKIKEAKGVTDSKQITTDKANATSSPSSAAPTAASVTAKVPEGYVLYENTTPKFSFAYPKEWDAHKEVGWDKGVSIDIKPVNEWIPYGWGSAMSYKYDSAKKSWVSFDTPTKQESAYSPMVLWKDDVKSVYDLTAGEGGGWQNKIVFVKGDKIYFILAPKMQACEHYCYSDSSKASSDPDVWMEQIAKSIVYQ